MKRSTRNNPVRAARREANFTRMRLAQPAFRRGTKQFKSPLRESIRHLDLTQATESQMQAWKASL